MKTIGIVGRGDAARIHALRYQRLPGANVVGVAAHEPPRAFVDEYTDGATAYGSAAAMITESAPDVVDVCTPTDAHRGPVELAADSGAAILCETPLERTLEDCFAVADTVDDAGVPFMPAHVSRFTPAATKAAARIREGTLGTVGNARTYTASDVPSPDSWYQSRDRSGGALYDLAVHDFAFLRRVCGDVDRVFARRATSGPAEYALTTLRFADGAVGHVDTRWTTREDDARHTRFEFAGTDGHIEFDSIRSTPVDVSGTGDGSRGDDPLDTALAADPYARELDHFLDCVDRGTAPQVTLDDALAVARVGLAALDSVASGVPITPADVD